MSLRSIQPSDGIPTTVLYVALVPWGLQSETGGLYSLQMDASLKELRKNAGLTLREAGEQVGIHPQSLWRLEHGTRRARRPVKLLLAQAYGVSIDVIEEACHA